MNTTTWRDWYGELDTALTDLRSQCDFVAVCGLSMGGALALRLAEQRPDDVDALVLVNPAIALKRLDLKLVPVLSRVLPSMPGVGNDIKLAGAGRGRLRPHAAQGDGVAAAAVARRPREPRQGHRSAADVPLDRGPRRRRHHGRPGDEGGLLPVRELVELNDSYHVATLDHDAEFIMERSAQFLADHAPVA